MESEVFEKRFMEFAKKANVEIPEPFNHNEPLSSLGFDSLDTLELVLALEEDSGTRVSDTYIYSFDCTYNDIFNLFR